MNLAKVDSQTVARVNPLRIEELVDSFISSQDVKLSSKLLYRRTLKQYFSWVDKKSPGGYPGLYLYGKNNLLFTLFTE